MNILREIFQNENGYSTIAFAFFIMLFFFIAVSGVVLWHGLLPGVEHLDILGKAKDMIQWLGGLFVAEKAPAAIRAYKGDPK